MFVCVCISVCVYLFKSLINSLQTQPISQVCNHPDLFEPRAIITPFVSTPLVFSTSHLVLNALTTTSVMLNTVSSGLISNIFHKNVDLDQPSIDSLNSIRTPSHIIEQPQPKLIQQPHPQKSLLNHMKALLQSQYDAALATQASNQKMKSYTNERKTKVSERNYWERANCRLTHSFGKEFGSLPIQLEDLAGVHYGAVSLRNGAGMRPKRRTGRHNKMRSALINHLHPKTEELDRIYGRDAAGSDPNDPIEQTAGLRGERAKRASLDEDEHTRDESRERLQTIWLHSNTKLTPSILLTRFTRFALVSSKMRTISLRSAQMDAIFVNFVFAVPKAGAKKIKIATSSANVQEHLFEEKSTRLFKKPLANYLTSFWRPEARLTSFFPDKKLIQFDAGKLQKLAELLRTLKVGKHRCLIFTQMSKMLDVLEAFLNLNGHTYLRLDGSTGVEKRQRLMDRFNGDEKLFVFILSTRSGGLGINLTGADTVIFYDSDWNPAMDAQAQDRAHRIGQTRDVHIYRMVTEHTIEENILIKARQKRHLDYLVMDEGKFTSENNEAAFSKNSLKDLLVSDKEKTKDLYEEDDEEEDEEDEEEEGGEMTAKEVEAAMNNLEDNDDVVAMKAATEEAKADLDDFDESAKVNGDGRGEEGEGEGDGEEGGEGEEKTVEKANAEKEKKKEKEVSERS